LATLREAPDLYFDGVSQIRLDHWTKGRTALLGDAAACVSLLAGEGTGLAMVEAYVLAGELCNCDGNYPAAFQRYEQRLTPFLRDKQRAAARFASSFAPKTNWGIAARNLITRFLNFPPVADFFLARDLRDNFDLPDFRF
jgi:2-polyprenyl-6-methoxyphenol hydroxylase-like FAD-dependent oxidoreductase